MADKNKLKTFQDLHSVIANLAAHYIPRTEIKEYFAPEVIEGVQKKPSYSVTPDERGLIERVVFRLVEKKNKTIGEGDEQRTVEANASESIVKAAAEDIPRILRDAEDLAAINPSNINPTNVQPFLTHTKETIMAYLKNNESRLKRYGEEAFAKAIANINTIDAHVETQVRHACKKKLHILETDLRDAQDAEEVIRTDNDKLAGEKEALSQVVVELEADKVTRDAEIDQYEADQSEFGHAWGKVAGKNASLKARNASLAKDVEDLAKDVAVLATDKRNLQSDLAQTIQYTQAEVKELQERVMNAEQDKDARAKEVKDLQERLMYTEHDLTEEIEGMHLQLMDANEDILELSEKSASLEAEKDEEIENRTQLEEAFEALYDQYRARFTELGNSVAEWYAFTEGTLLKNTELCQNEVVKGLRGKNTELAGLVTDMLEEVKSGARFKGKKQVPVGWKPGEEAPLPTLEETDSRYQEIETEYQGKLDKVSTEHSRQIWAMMHLIQDIPDSAYSPEQKKAVYERFLAAKPKDASIQGIVHCHIGKIMYDNTQDYASARAAFVEAVKFGKQELQERPADKDAQARVALYQNNIRECNKKLAA